MVERRLADGTFEAVPSDASGSRGRLRSRSRRSPRRLSPPAVRAEHRRRSPPRSDGRRPAGHPTALPGAALPRPPGPRRTGAQVGGLSPFPGRGPTPGSGSTPLQLDDLVGLAGELVVLSDNLQGLREEPRVAPWLHALESLERVSREIRDTTLDLRMVPVDELFSRFPRVVRDLADRSGKEIELRIVGQETRLDRTIVERLGDPWST